MRYTQHDINAAWTIDLISSVQNEKEDNKSCLNLMFLYQDLVGPP